MILPTISKVLEKAVHSQVYRYLIDNKILTPRQFGFRPKISTEIALAHFTDTILANMDKGLVTGAVFLDLAKAFDTVDHSLLFEKLASSGLSHDSVNWFKSYLTNRNQLTALDNTVSTFKHVCRFLKSVFWVHYYILFLLMICLLVSTIVKYPYTLTIL
jgi:hypothetical protein